MEPITVRMNGLQANKAKTKLKRNVYTLMLLQKDWQCSVNGGGDTKCARSLKRKQKLATGSVRVNQIPNVCNASNTHPNISHDLYQEWKANDLTQ